MDHPQVRARGPGTEGMRWCSMGRASVRGRTSDTHAAGPRVTPRLLRGILPTPRSSDPSETPCLLDAASYLYILERHLYVKIALRGSRYGTGSRRRDFVWENR
jgi:hypothetical protein